MINCVIIEDDKIGQEILIKKLTNSYPECNIMAIIENKNEAIDFIKKNNIDLVFLDVQLSDGNGIDILQECVSRNFESILITAHEGFALKALNQNASYYILKPKGTVNGRRI